MFATLVVATSSVLSLINTPEAHATGSPTFTGGSSVSGTLGQATDITDLQVSGTGNPTIPMTLRVSHGTLQMTNETGLTFTGSDNAATLAFSGTLSDINTDLATLKYTSNALGSDSLEASMVGANEVYDPNNGHVYEFVDGPVTWDDAFTAASTYTYNGLTGYLATVTSADENAYLTARLPDGGWIGASDAAQEGQWKWIDGPENGTLFYTGNGGDGSGQQVDGVYSNWNSGEPNNSGGDENCAQFLSGSTGLWNDLECSSETLPYVVEFGGPSDLPSVAFTTVSITTTAPTETAATCAELQALDDSPNSQYATITLTHDIDCTGYNVDPLFSSTGFSGTFNGQGHTISHLDYEHASDGSIGLISYAYDGATIENLNLSDGIVKGQYNVGGLLGYSEGSLTINNVTSNLTISSDCEEYGGGLIGGMYFGSNQTVNITNSSMTGENDCSYYVGGLIGYIESGGTGTATLSKDFNSGNMTTTQNAQVEGGIIGDVDTEPGTIVLNNVYNQGNINAPNTSYVGGIAGLVEAYDEGSSGPANITIENAYNSGDISGSQYVGGLIGGNRQLGGDYTTETIQNTFNAGGLTSGDNTTTGAIIGDSEVNNDPYTITSINNYYDATADTGFSCSPVNSISDCTAINTAVQPAYFKANRVNQPMHAWNFSSIWRANANSYPTFGNGSDSDGVPDSVENTAPNNGDANGDGIADSQQDNVASFVDDSTGKYVVLQVPDSCSISSANTASETANTVHDSGFNYPLGMMNFTINCETVGSKVTVTQYYYGASGSYVLRKYNPNSGAYFTVNGASYQQVTIGGQNAIKVTYQVTDGSSSDDDSIANGTIVDPAGLGVADVGVPNTGLSPINKL